MQKPRIQGPRNRAATLARRIGRNGAARAYAAASALLLVLLGSQQVSHRWGSDVWHHGAVVRAFAESPFDPDHPVLPGDAPHPFFVPSSLLAGAIVAAGGVEPFDALVLVALLNLGLVLAGIRLFVRSLLPDPWAPVVALGFVLFLWGPNPWGYSGFLHLNQIGQSLPFPSTFAFGAALLALAAFRRWLSAPGFAPLAAGVLLAPLVVLSHPVASIFLCTVLAAFLLRHIGDPKAWLGAAGMGLSSLAAALLWPYYPFFELIEASAAFDASNRVLYEGTLIRTLPLLPGFAVAAGRLRRDPRDPLALSILGLTGVYAAGFVLERWSLGRVMSPLAVLLQVALAGWVLARKDELASALATPGRRGLPARAAAVLLGVLAVVNMAPGFARTVPPALLPERLADDPRLAAVDHRHRFLRDRIGYGDVVLARPRTGWSVPVYGGKILSPLLPQGFVDVRAMQADVERFFAPGAERDSRLEIQERYRVRWILVDARNPDGARLLPELAQVAGPVAVEGGLHLLSTDRKSP